MTFQPPSAQRSRNMAAVRGRDTKPELALRRLLHAQGMRYRLHYRLDLPGGRVRPDIAFTRKKVAIFVDGCFWHMCPTHGTWPASNSGFWRAKLSRNVDRDRENDATLAAAGWQVIRIWEHESLTDAANRIINQITKDNERL